MKLEMTQDNERLPKCRLAMLIGSGPAFSWQPVSRGIKGTETHWSTPSGLDAPLMTGKRKLLEWDSTIIIVNTNHVCGYIVLICVCLSDLSDNYCTSRICTYPYKSEVQGRQHGNGHLK